MKTNEERTLLLFSFFLFYLFQNLESFVLMDEFSFGKFFSKYVSLEFFLNI